MAFLTVFTPAYNRAHTLPRTYESLCAQDCKDFIWLIVDDGSSDHTAELVREWQSRDNGFDIQYIYKENGGMHTAHNTAYANIHTELNTCIDSDDALAEGAVSKILAKWELIKGKGYAGIVGLDSDMDGKLIGKGFPEELTETTLSSYYAAGGKGDKKLVYRTDVINAVPPYPVYANEKYFSLGYKYRLIDQNYKLATLNEVLVNVDYQADGSSATMWKQYIKNPKGFAAWRKICLQYPASKKRMFVDCIHYVSNNLLAHQFDFIRQSPKKGMTFLAVPLGLLLCVYTHFKAK